jgi:hypothetical protein
MSAWLGLNNSKKRKNINNDSSYNANKIQKVAVSTTAPTDGQLLTYVASASDYVPESASSAGLVTLTGVQTVSNKSFPDSSVSFVNSVDNTKILSFSLSDQTTGTTVNIDTTNTASITLNLPSSSDTIVGRATSDTLTNKIINSPTINSVSVTGNIIQGDVSTQTLSITWTGPFTATTNAYYRLQGGVVTVRLAVTQGNSVSGTTLAAGSALPAGYRPSVNQNGLCVVQTTSSTYPTGNFTVNTLGIITIWNAGFTNFPASGTVGFLDQSIAFPIY